MVAGFLNHQTKQHATNVIFHQQKTFAQSNEANQGRWHSAQRMDLLD
jgi:hypothetical protein